MIDHKKFMTKKLKDKKFKEKFIKIRKIINKITKYKIQIRN